jgi:glucose/galactose transporter
MSTENKKSFLVPFLIIAGMFFIFGFVTWINGALIPFMKTMCELSDAESFLVVSASYISFVVMALPASALLKRIGYKRGMSLGLILMGVGALVFIPAASSRTYTLFLIGIFIQGAGMTVIQTASNPYITILGPIESAAKRISIMGICNKIAGALGSIIFGVLLLSGIKEINEKLGTLKGEARDVVLDQMADSVVGPYIIMAIALGVLGVLINFAPLPDLNMGEDSDGDDSSSESDLASSKTSVFQFPHLLLGVLALFMYVGVEVAAGDTIIAYGISMDLEGATRFTSFTLGFMVLTYILGAILIPKVISQKVALVGSAVLGVVFTICITITEGFTSVIFVALLGVANALVWPAIWPLAINKLGKYTKDGAALLIMAIAGGAVISPLYGVFVGSQKDSMVGEQSIEIDAAVKGADQLLVSFPKFKVIDSNEVALNSTLLAKVEAANLNLDTASIELAKKGISNENVIKYIKLSNADIHGAFDLSVGLNIAKDSLVKLVKAIGKDPELAPSFATAFVNTFTGGIDMTGEFNAWGDKLNKVINSADKSTVSEGIDNLIALTTILKEKISGKADLGKRLEEIVTQLEKSKDNLTKLDGNDNILSNSASELGKADALIKPVVAKASTSGYWVLLPCYLIILFFALKGYKIGLPKES